MIRLLLICLASVCAGLTVLAGNPFLGFLAALTGPFLGALIAMTATNQGAAHG